MTVFFVFTCIAGVKNDILSVTVKQRCGGDLEISCTSHRGSHKIERCVIFYSLLPTNFANTSDSSMASNESDNTVWNALFEPSSAFVQIEAFSVGGVQDIAVHGIFETVFQSMYMLFRMCL